MRFYSRRVYSDYRADLNTAGRLGMPDTDDVTITSKDFARKYGKHLLEIAHRKNVEYSSSGVLDRNDLINEVGYCFTMAWNRINWEVINESPEDERQAVVWKFIKKTVTYRLGDRIRAQKDGIRVPHREMFADSYKDHDKEAAQFDAISSMFGQLDLEFMMGDNAIQQDDYYNDMLIDVLNDHFTRYLSPKHRSVLEWTIGFDGNKLSAKEIAERLDITVTNVGAIKNRAMKKLMSEKSMRDLALVIDGNPGLARSTGSNFLEILK